MGYFFKIIFYFYFFDIEKRKELKNLEKYIRTELNAAKKMGVADIKLELAELKSKK